MPRYKVEIWANALIVAADPVEAAAEVRLGNWTELIGIGAGPCHEIDDPEDLGPTEFPAQAVPASGGEER